MTTLLFLNIAWMNRYQGLVDDTPERGGRFVTEHHYGHEVFNFRPWLGKMYGFVEPGTNSRTEKPRTIRIERLEASPSDADSVTDVLVVWVATHPEGRRRIVGWYDHATVFRNRQPSPPGADRQIRGVSLAHGDDGVAGFYVRASEKDCYLLRPDERDCIVPLNVLRRSNIGYAEGAGHADFRNQVVDYVRDRGLDDVRETQKYGRGGEGEEHKSLSRRR